MTATAGSGVGVDSLHAELHECDEVCVLRLEGTLVAETAQAGKEVFEHLKASPCASLIVDASLLSEIDHVGVDVLADLHNSVQRNDGSMTVYAATGPVARALAGSPLRDH